MLGGFLLYVQQNANISLGQASLVLPQMQLSALGVIVPWVNPPTSRTMQVTLNNRMQCVIQSRTMRVTLNNRMQCVAR